MKTQTCSKLARIFIDFSQCKCFVGIAMPTVVCSAIPQVIKGNCIDCIMYANVF